MCFSGRWPQSVIHHTKTLYAPRLKYCVSKTASEYWHNYVKKLWAEFRSVNVWHVQLRPGWLFTELVRSPNGFSSDHLFDIMRKFLVETPFEMNVAHRFFDPLLFHFWLYTPIYLVDFEFSSNTAFSHSVLGHLTWESTKACNCVRKSHMHCGSLVIVPLIPCRRRKNLQNKALGTLTFILLLLVSIRRHFMASSVVSRVLYSHVTAGSQDVRTAKFWS